MDYLTALLYLITALLLVYKLAFERKAKDILLLALFVAAAVVLFSIEGVLILPLLCGVVIFNSVLSSYGKTIGNVFIILAIYCLLVIHGFGVALVLQSFVLGALSSPRHYPRPKRVHKAEMRTERLRNLFQICVGVILILLFLLVPWQNSALILLFVFMAGIALGNQAINYPRSLLASSLSRMEREGFDLGHGAVWLGIGALFAAAFLNSLMIIVVFSAIFIADSLSTLVGVQYGRIKLPQNKKKSLAGTAAYAACVLVISYPILGYVAVPIAVLAAVIESLPLTLDDNFSVSLVLTAVMALLL